MTTEALTEQAEAQAEKVARLIADIIAAQRAIRDWEAIELDPKRAQLRAILAETGLREWSAPEGRALLIDAKGQIDWQAAYKALVAAIERWAENHPLIMPGTAATLDDLLDNIIHVDNPEDWRKPGTTRLEVRPQLVRVPAPDVEAQLQASIEAAQ